VSARRRVSRVRCERQRKEILDRGHTSQVDMTCAWLALQKLHDTKVKYQCKQATEQAIALSLNLPSSPRTAVSCLTLFALAISGFHFRRTVSMRLKQTLTLSQGPGTGEHESSWLKSPSHSHAVPLRQASIDRQCPGIVVVFVANKTRADVLGCAPTTMNLVSDGDTHIVPRL
jgi:hypothetical protein